MGVAGSVEPLARPWQFHRAAPAELRWNSLTAVAPQGFAPDTSLGGSSQAAFPIDGGDRSPGGVAGTAVGGWAESVGLDGVLSASRFARSGVEGALHLPLYHTAMNALHGGSARWRGAPDAGGGGDEESAGADMAPPPLPPPPGYRERRRALRRRQAAAQRD